MKTAIIVIAAKLLCRQGKKNRIKKKKKNMMMSLAYLYSFFPSLSCCGFSSCTTKSSDYCISNLQVITYFSMSIGDKKRKNNNISLIGTCFVNN
jgi:hypothetical protein